MWGAVNRVQIILFILSTSKYCCVALLTGSSSTREAEPTGDTRAEVTSSSAVAGEQRERPKLRWVRVT
ncbi:hypothetical protein EYF80_022343 [Liparis tanakae]|uniref:Secreted protein n=1 Tax=Liparis tanakae TaxID=230148 RepID=A0A4Z2HNK2_9TELE|nr:hypothetical protein EYF80_022343 [Liparis tanakae]